MNYALMFLCRKIKKWNIPIIKAMSKQQLADAAGVSVTTLMNWCKPYQKELEALGMKPNSKVLSPKIVSYIADLFCIDISQRGQSPL